MKNFVKIGLVCIGIMAISVVLSRCSTKGNDEATQQIAEAPQLAKTPTYYVEKKSDLNDIDVIQIKLRREAGKADGDLDSLITVDFYKEYTPSAEYIKVKDSIKIQVLPQTNDIYVDGRYERNVTYECYLYVFVDQLSILLQKHKELYGEE